MEGKPRSQPVDFGDRGNKPGSLAVKRDKH